MRSIPAATFKGSVFATYRKFISNPLAFLQSYAMHESGICSFRIFRHRIIHISDPAYLQQVFQVAPEKYTQGRDRDHMKLLFGNGLLTSTGEHWKKQRALIQPCFSPKQVAGMVDKINDRLAAHPLSSEQDLHEWSLRVVNSIMAELIFSDTSDDVLAIGNELVDLKAVTLARLRDYSLPLWIPAAGNLAFKQKRKKVYEAIFRKVDAEPGGNKNDLLEAFRKAGGNSMSRGELAEELLGIYAAAHEPVAIALTYTLKLISEHPRVFERLEQEIQTGHPADRSAQEPYMKQVIRESLRLYPPVWISGKRALENDRIGDFHIRKNDNLVYSPMILHRNPSYWKHPERFIPERFENEKHHPLAWLPFGGGQKFCVGSHLAMTILQLAVEFILKNYRLEPDAANEVSIIPFTTLKPLKQLKIRAEKISV